MPEIEQAIRQEDLTVAAVLSGNRNFEGRVHPLTKVNWLMSPPLVVAYALAGRMDVDLTSEPLGHDAQGQPVMLEELWPSLQEVNALVSQVSGEQFQRNYQDLFAGPEAWQQLPVPGGDEQVYSWDPNSTYVKEPPFFQNFPQQPPEPQGVDKARILAQLGDSITTDHISPAGAIPADSPAGRYLQEQGIGPEEFNSYGSRRGNHEVMVRGTLANIRIRNEMVPEKEGGFTRHMPSGQVMAIYDAAMRYQQAGVPLMLVAGKEYGTGSSRDWAAKGVLLLGIKVVLAESYERIHRSNLIGMGVLPVQFKDGENRHTLGLQGSEQLSLPDLPQALHEPQASTRLVIQRASGEVYETQVRTRLDTPNEITYYRQGGILAYVLRQKLQD